MLNEINSSLPISFYLHSLKLTFQTDVTCNKKLHTVVEISFSFSLPASFTERTVQNGKRVKVCVSVQFVNIGGHGMDRICQHGFSLTKKNISTSEKIVNKADTLLTGTKKDSWDDYSEKHTQKSLKHFNRVFLSCQISNMGQIR